MALLVLEKQLQLLPLLISFTGNFVVVDLFWYICMYCVSTYDLYYFMEKTDDVMFYLPYHILHDILQYVISIIMFNVVLCLQYGLSTI